MHSFFTRRQVALLTGLWLFNPAGAAPLSAPTYLDAGSVAPVRENAIRLTLTDTYDAARGYGWSKPPRSAFAHPSFDGVRSPPLTDGLAGEDFTLRLDLAPGRWSVIAFLDDGWRDAHQVVLQINGVSVPHNPRIFGLEEEPDATPINRYRVAQFPVTGGGSMDLGFSLPASGARLLALRLLPLDWTESEMTHWFRRQIAEVGSHDSSAPLDALRADLAQHGRTPALAKFCAYWLAQLDLLAEAEQWHRARGWDWVSKQTRSSMFTRYKLALSLLDPLVEHADGDAFPLLSRALWLRARLLYWIWVEQHLADDQKALAADLAILRRQFPDDRLIAMYAGEDIKEPEPLDSLRPSPDAPAWSTAQAEVLWRLRDVAHYWIDERQIPNGEFGGKTDDDVELLRWWPALLFSGDAKARTGFGKLAEGVWFSPRLHLGYSREPRDVEHSAEFIADTVPLIALLTGAEPWVSRLSWSHRHMRDLWTGHNQDGDRQFKSAWIGATEILEAPPRNRDVSMNTRAAKAVRYHAWLAHDAAADRMLHDWSLTWAKAAARTDKNKPPGLFPASLRWPDTAFNGDEPTWHRANMFWRYFEWTADGMLYDQLLFSWLRTANPILLQPFVDTLALLEAWPDAAARSDQPVGSAGWAASMLYQSGEFWSAVAQWRLESGDARYDNLLRTAGPPYLRYRLGGDVAGLAVALERDVLEVLRYNRPMRTTEVLFTDRVRVARAGGIETIVAMLTGCAISDSQSPYYHVAWEDAPATFTALVTSTGRDHVAAKIFTHQSTPANVAALFFRLPPGLYRFVIQSGDQILVDRVEEVKGPRHRVKFEIPGNRLLNLKISLPESRPSKDD